MLLGHRTDLYSPKVMKALHDSCIYVLACMNDLILGLAKGLYILSCIFLLLNQHLFPGSECY